MRPTFVRSAFQAGREDTYLKTGELRSSYDPRNLLTDAGTAQMKANVKIPVMGSKVRPRGHIARASWHTVKPYARKSCRDSH
eukprot:COSAG06_NODE_7375_length_2524_cov_1.708041_5_plen_81_part_01